MNDLVAAVVQIDTQDNPGLAARFGVRSIPVLLMLKEGKVIDRLAGAQPAGNVVAWSRRHL